MDIFVHQDSCSTLIPKLIRKGVIDQSLREACVVVTASVSKKIWANSIWLFPEAQYCKNISPS